MSGLCCDVGSFLGNIDLDDRARRKIRHDTGKEDGAECQSKEADERQRDCVICASGKMRVRKKMKEV